MEARIDIALAEERLMAKLAQLGLNNNTNPRNTPKPLAENEFLIHSQAKHQDDGMELAKANMKRGDDYIEKFSLIEHSGSSEDIELSLRLLENALEYYQKAVKDYSHLAPELYQKSEETQSLSYRIQMAERIRDFYLRPTFYRFGDSSLAESNEYVKYASPVMIKAFKKGLEILEILLERLARAEEIQQEEEEKFKQKQSTRMSLPASGQQFLANTVSSTTKELLSFFQENKQFYEKFDKSEAFEAYANRLISFSMQHEQFVADINNAFLNSNTAYLKQQFKGLRDKLEYLDNVSKMDNTNTVLTSSANKRARDNDDDDDKNLPKNDTEKKKVKTQINGIVPNNAAENPGNTSMQIEQYNPYDNDPKISEYSLY